MRCIFFKIPDAQLPSKFGLGRRVGEKPLTQGEGVANPGCSLEPPTFLAADRPMHIVYSASYVNIYKVYMCNLFLMNVHSIVFWYD